MELTEKEREKWVESKVCFQRMLRLSSLLTILLNQHWTQLFSVKETWENFLFYLARHWFEVTDSFFTLLHQVMTGLWLHSKISLSTRDLIIMTWPHYFWKSQTTYRFIFYFERNSWPGFYCATPQIFGTNFDLVFGNSNCRFFLC